MTLHNDYSKKGLKRLINRVGKERIDYLLELQRADMKCSSKDRDISVIEKRRQEIKEIIEENQPVEKKQLAIDGSHIVDLGYKQGEIIGQILNYLLEIVLEKPELNEKETLIKIVLDKFEL